MVHTVTLDCDEEVLCVSTPQASDDNMFLSTPTASSSPLPSDERHTSKSTSAPVRIRKRKRVSDPNDCSEVIGEALSVLKACSNEPQKADIPYACGILVQNVFRKYPDHLHLDLSIRLNAFLQKLEEEVKI